MADKKENPLVGHALPLPSDIIFYRWADIKLSVRPVFYLSGHVYNDDPGLFVLDLGNPAVFQNRLYGGNYFFIQHRITP